MLYKTENRILLSHGSGGKRSRDLIQQLFFKYFENEILAAATDAAILNDFERTIAFTTDSFVVDPLFFPGGDIGKLAVYGTVNDLSVSGAVPKYLSAGFILEEGLDFALLERIVKSMAAAAKNAGVQIVTGDTKVVNHGKCDKIFINTTGIGILNPKFNKIGSGEKIRPGDKIVVNGFIADHGMAVLSARNDLKVNASVESDCAPLNCLIQEVLTVSPGVKYMRDATRGGLATILVELVQDKNFGVRLLEEQIPVRENVRGMCEFFGFDPLYIANEGKVIIVVPSGEEDKIVQTMQKNRFGTESRIIGEIVNEHPGKVILQTQIGGKRIIDMLTGDQLPRIC